MGKKRDYGVSAEEFIAVWNASDTVYEVTQKLDMPREVVLARAAYYRGKGVEMKKLTRSSVTSLDVDELNRIAEEARNRTGRKSVLQRELERVTEALEHARQAEREI